MASRTFDTLADKVKSPPLPALEEIAGKFPQFEVVECLGRGGMGVVYKARQKSLDRWVAIKVLAPERKREERFAEHFEREAKTLAKMSHPNIVTVFDHGEADGWFYIVMELVDGVNLRDLLREGKMEPEQALAIVPPVCDALEYAHDKGVVHRDIKPENLLLDREGRVKIADFGIASLVGVTGEKSGTPPYMAPEQQQGTVDRRADIYALGVVLYEMLTGERPGKELEPPSRKVQIDVRLDEVVLRALERKPELRYQQASAFKTEVETIVADTADPGTRASDAATEPQGPLGPSRFQWNLWALLGAAVGTSLWMPVAAIFSEWSGLGIALSDAAALAILTTAFTLWLQRRRLSAFLGLMILLGAAFLANLAFMLGGHALGLELLTSWPGGKPASPLHHAWMLSLYPLMAAWFWMLERNARSRSTSDKHHPPTSSAPPGRDPDRCQAETISARSAAQPNVDCPLTMEDWLALMDRGDYAGSWETAAPSFQAGALRKEWVEQLEKARRPLGEIRSRKLASMENTVVGRRYVAKYASAFEGLPSAIETVQYDKQAGGEWLPTGYLVQPAEPVAPRFSRAAILGAAWIGLFFVNWMVSYTPPGWAVTQFFRGSALEVVAELFLFLPLMVLGFAAILGGPAMGGVALREIRRDEGRTGGFVLALFDLLFFPLVLFNGWAAWLLWHVLLQSGRVHPAWAYTGTLALIAFDGWLVVAARKAAFRFVRTPAPPPGPRPTGSWSQVLTTTGWRLLLVIVFRLALSETLFQMSVHWKESTSELWEMALAIATLGGLIWACSPAYRLKGSWWGWGAGTGLSALALLGLANFYSWHLRPNLGLYQEPDWVAQHPGFQRQLRKRIEASLWEPRNPTDAGGTTDTPRFGPVMERLVHDGRTASGRDMLLNLDTGELKSEPTDPRVLSDPDLMLQALAEQGIDLAAVNQREAWAGEEAEAFDSFFFTQSGQHLPAGPLKGIISYGMVVTTLDAGEWTSLSPGALRAMLNQAGLPTAKPMRFHSAMGTSPVTIGFRTREGGVGILQVIECSDDPRGVKVRYKLVDA
ncbi:MAG: protein kinase [Verrucomicrobiales bacterium]|nr:protein kinase [Verrucomicrobiales bacterium]